MRPALVLGLGCLLLYACESEELAPHAPVGGTNPWGMVGTAGQTTGTDAGANDAAEDAGDGGAAIGCAEIEEGDPNNHVTITSDDGEIDFDELAVYAVWDPDACEDNDEVLVVGFTADSCAPGESEQVRFIIPRDSGSGLEGGNTLLGTSDDEIDVRYNRPHPPGADDQWGNCTGAFGEVTFSEVGFTEDSFMEANFDLTLTDCGTTDNESITVEGEFSVEVAEDFNDACP